MRYSQHRAIVCTLSAVAAIALGATVGASPADATIDGANSVIDHDLRTVQALSEDTRITAVQPMDGNPLTREWYHDGTAAFHVSGPGAKDWHGHITVGYMVGYPATLDGKLKFEYETPGLEFELTNPPALDFNDLVPRIGGELDVGLGPGVKSVDAADGDVHGAEGFIRLSGFHCTVTGVLGTTTIRPFVKLVSSDGDTVIAYGPTTKL
ncbi:MspA family porin [Nocardia alni]|uniref:MspA family porin n=1 Tax=Nocardia alni TaxID=2815723 RepID=UPI001C2400AF|nr:MspA family porin [Nocardia alni]